MSAASLAVGGRSGQVLVLKNADLLWHLRRTGLVDGLDEADETTIAAGCTDAILDVNEVIYDQGDPPDRLFVVNRGSVRLTATAADGREMIVGVLGAGALFGEEALGGTEGSRRSRAVAHEECWVFSIGRDELRSLMLQLPRFAVNLVELLNRSLEEAREELEVFSFRSTEERVAGALVKLSSRHGREVVGEGSVRKLRIPVSHELLAQMVGANRPHVSAIMSQFRKRGWIRYQKRRLLIDVAELSGLAGPQPCPV